MMFQKPEVVTLSEYLPKFFSFCMKFSVYLTDPLPQLSKNTLYKEPYKVVGTKKTVTLHHVAFALRRSLV